MSPGAGQLSSRNVSKYHWNDHWLLARNSLWSMPIMCQLLIRLSQLPRASLPYWSSEWSVCLCAAGTSAGLPCPPSPSHGRPLEQTDTLAHFTFLAPSLPPFFSSCCQTLTIWLATKKERKALQSVRHYWSTQPLFLFYFIDLSLSLCRLILLKWMDAHLSLSPKINKTTSCDSTFWLLS